MGGRNFVALLRSNGDLGYCHAEGPAILAGHGYLNIGWAKFEAGHTSAKALNVLGPRVRPVRISYRTNPAPKRRICSGFLDRRPPHRTPLAPRAV